jgi:hypothetical protein
VRLTFDRGTLLIEDPPGDLDLAELPEVRWDPRVGKHRAPACNTYKIASDVRRRGIVLAEVPRPTLVPPSGFRPVELRPYQEAALVAWQLAARRGVIALPTGSTRSPSPKRPTGPSQIAAKRGSATARAGRVDAAAVMREVERVTEGAALLPALRSSG